MADQILERLREFPGVEYSELEKYRMLALPPTLKEFGGLISVIVPVYNEVASVGPTLARLACLPLNVELVIIDDCSTDGTRDHLKTLEELPGIQLILKDRNQGKGSALKLGFRKFTGQYVIIQDADLEYDPVDIPAVLEPLISGKADVVYGSRFFDGAKSSTLIHRTGNVWLTRISNWFNRLQLTDMETCYKGFRADVIRSIRVEQKRFGIEPNR